MCRSGMGVTPHAAPDGAWSSRCGVSINMALLKELGSVAPPEFVLGAWKPRGRKDNFILRSISVPPVSEHKRLASATHFAQMNHFSPINLASRLTHPVSLVDKIAQILEFNGQVHVIDHDLLRHVQDDGREVQHPDDSTG